MDGKPPLDGLRVVELAGLAPGPFCGQLLSSNGASVLRIDRSAESANQDILVSRKSSISLDLKIPGCIQLLKILLQEADVLIDPYRPGVLERLGLSPAALLVSYPRLIILRMTGFRRDGPYKDMAGHDINYLAVSGVLSMLGAKGEPPLPPANILGDYAGGGLAAFAGVLLALIHRSSSSKGQVVEANMVDGASYIGTVPRLRTKEHVWMSERGTNLLDGGCPYYRCYECKDEGKYMSVGALESQFFANLLQGLGLTLEQIVPTGLSRDDKNSWPHMQAVLQKVFKTKTRKEWEHVFLGEDACVAPVLEHKEMETAGYEHKPMVHLSCSPSLPVTAMWEGKQLKPGQGGQEILKNWINWELGRHYDIEEGVFIARPKNQKL
ncbi:unnamed protein product [Clonostachys rhizophaga]|uniref:Alpha-methylacyl-CoA racemase n=1 Tax=Clonostachys rhizophaga TaxID=160324 RepID=A0A9N9VZF4_9HYPO|nr:unnamed protein product [Clonostachys rhizophaga]